MATKKGVISVVELKGLLHSIADARPDICVRMRVLGEMWDQNFLAIESITDRGVLLKDTLTGKSILFRNLNDVIQFELETSFQSYDAFFHYWVSEVPEFTMH